MKRPVLLYFVAGWCFFAMVIQAEALISLLFHLAGWDATGEFRKQLVGISTIIVIVHVILLVQLWCASRWITIVFLFSDVMDGWDWSRPSESR